MTPHAMRYHGLKAALALAVLGVAGTFGVAYVTMPQLKDALDARQAEAARAAEPPPKPKPQVPPVPPAPPGATLAAVGDIMLSRTVATAIKAAGGDVHYPFAAAGGVLADADLVFANLETPVTKGRVIHAGEMTFRSDPATVAGVKDAGVTLVSLANNHVPNMGAKGVLDTVANLDAAGILHAGAGADDAAAGAPAILERGGLRFAFLAYNDSDVVPRSYGAAPKHPGTNLMDAKKMAMAVAAVRPKADVVIVSMHSGTEYKETPNAHQTDFAHAAIDAGADAVIGHHPHVVQTVEVYKGKPIIYSLGNFIFDQDWSEETKNGLAVRLRFGAKGATRIELEPVYLAKTGQPAPADQAHADHVLARLKATIADVTAYVWAKGSTAPTTERRKAVLVAPTTRDCATVETDLDGDGTPEFVAIGQDGACGDGRVTVWHGVGDDESVIWRSDDAGFASLTVESRPDGGKEIVALR